MPKSSFTLDHITHLDIDFHQLELTRGGSYIELPDWIALKKAVINPKNKDEECFRWAAIALLHHEEIGKDPQRITKLKPFADQYNWEGLEFPMDYKTISKSVSKKLMTSSVICPRVQKCPPARSKIVRK